MTYIVSFLYKNHYAQRRVREGDKLTIGSSPKDNIPCEDYKSGQITIKNKNGLVISGRTQREFELSGNTVEGIHILDQNPLTLFYVDREKAPLAQSIELPHNGSVTVGRNSKCDIVINNRYVSSRHCTISRENGVYYVSDNNSTNGTYVNSLKITRSKLSTGDEIHIFNYVFRVDSGAISVFNAGGDVIVQRLPSGATNVKGSAYRQGSRPVYRRSPRTQEELPHDDIVLAAPPSKGQKYEKNRGMFASVASSVAMVGSSLLMGGMGASAAMQAAQKAALVASRGSMLVMPATSIATQTSQNKRTKKKLEDYARLRELRFADYLNEQRARIASVASQQQKILTDENPAPSACINNTIKLNRNLWERTPLDRDYLDVRLGMGYEELCVKVMDRGEAYGIELEDDDAKEMSALLVEESKYVDNLPVRVRLAENTTIGVIGDRSRVIAQVKNMITSLTSLHCYTDVKIIGIFDEEEKAQWADLRWLPHIWDDHKQRRYLAFDEKEAHAICDGFNDMLKTRIREKTDSAYGKTALPNPYYIMILGSKRLVEHEEIFKNLCTNDPSLGITTLFLFDQIYNLPIECEFIIDMQENAMAYHKSKVNSKFIFTEDAYSPKAFDSYARWMSAIELQGYAVQAEIPSSITFLEGYGVKLVEDLNIAERWENNKSFKSLAAPIGMMAGNKTLCLNVRENKSSADEHGPHGLVAGMTGSGKSEMLQTWILSMCVNYHPYDVNFVIIDYKGGGMANLLEAMPHVVGKITNIGTNINRSLVSLQQEAKRRMAMMDAAGVNNIDKYQKAYYEGKVSEPMPHLIIVADEFAELKKEEPDFMKGLVSFARVGRSLGVHLVLATQKPSGVVDDQIDANSRFRLCLKVQDIGDSREMLRSPEAAMITQAGRGYMKIGNFEFFEQFQSYWSGAPYLGDKVEKVSSGNQVRLVAMNGERIKTVEEEKTRFKSEVDELKAVNNYICFLAREMGIKQLPGPWLEELPEELPLNCITEDFGGFNGEGWESNSLEWLEIPVGKFDLPENQQQGIQKINFAEDGHYGVYGSSGTGKTSFLKAMLTAACRLYSPEDINFYLIDCNSYSLSSYKEMPHVGDVILDSEDEKFSKFIQLITDEITERKKLFARNSVNSLSAYRSRYGKLPAIIVVIDNILPLFGESFTEMEEALITISQEGASRGVYLIYTANSTAGIRFKVLQNIKGAVALELTDKGDYSSIVGRMESKSIPRNRGRALFKSAVPIEFQTALFGEGKDDIERSEYIKALADQMDACWEGEVPKKIPIMPDMLDTEELKEEYKKRYRIPLGLRYSNIETAYADLQTKYCFLVSGSMGAGKSDFLCRLIDMMNREDNLLYLFDSEKGSFRRFESVAEGYCTNKDTDGAEAILYNVLFPELKRRQALQNAAKAQPDYRPDELILQEKQICIFIDDINEFLNETTDKARDMMNNIVRLSSHLGVVLIAAGRTSDLVRLADIEPTTNNIVKFQNGIALDSTPANHSFLKANNMSYSEKDTVADGGDAWKFFAEKCEKIKIN